MSKSHLSICRHGNIPCHTFSHFNTKVIIFLLLCIKEKLISLKTFLKLFDTDYLFCVRFQDLVDGYVLKFLLLLLD